MLLRKREQILSEKKKKKREKNKTGPEINLRMLDSIMRQGTQIDFLFS